MWPIRISQRKPGDGVNAYTWDAESQLKLQPAHLHL